MPSHDAELTIEVAAAPQRCFDLLLEYESFPDWQGAVKSAQVLSRDRQGRGKEVAFVMDAKLRTVAYTLRYRYDEPHSISWEYVEGDLKDVGGAVRLDEIGDGGTMVRYAVSINAGMWVPRPLASMLRDEGMKTALEELKKRAEQG